MKITFLGAAHEVTGSATLLEACGKKILVDYGMEQGADIYENADIPVNPAEIDAVFLTHAHIDHAGKLPLLTKHGYSGPIYATLATEMLSRMMLLDSAHIQENEAIWKTRKARRAGKPDVEPMYNTDDVSSCLKHFAGCSYGVELVPFEGVKAVFTDAGHLLGSASISFTVTENGRTQTVLFSGDLGNINRPLIRDYTRPEHADYVIIESTYGDRLHGERADYKSQLAEIIQRTLDRGGNLVIPAFAVGRTQELLYLIHEIKVEGRIKGHNGFPVWVDSPMAVEATKIYDGGLMDYYDLETLEYLTKGIDILQFDGLNMSVTTDESKALNADKTPKIILSASGMCEAGRIRHHLKYNLWREECTVLFVGYQSEGTLGRKLQDGATEVELYGDTVSVSAEIATMDGISGHADRKLLTDWLGSLKEPPKKVFVNHGEDSVTDSFAETIKAELGFEATAPYSGDSFELSEEGAVQTVFGSRKKIERAAEPKPEKNEAASKKNTGNASENKTDSGILYALERLKETVTGRTFSRKQAEQIRKEINKLTEAIGKILKKNTGSSKNKKKK